MSADTGWSLQILISDYNFRGSVSKYGSILSARGPLAIHPRVRDNGVFMRLGRFQKDH